MTEQPALVYARASIHLPGLPLREAVLVDPTIPYIAELLEHGYLVAEAITTDPPAAVSDG